MIILNMRSSSLGSLQMCEQKYALEYIIGLPSKTNSKAAKGTICHRALQLLADAKLCTDKGLKTVKNDDIGNIRVSTCNNIAKITTKCFNYYKENLKDVDLDEEKDLKDCIKWTQKAIEYNDGELDPRNQNVLNTEEYFEFEVKKPWSKYEYTLQGKKYTGNLVLRGTIDLILTENENTLQILDGS